MSLTVSTFERVDANPGVTLLRLTAQATPGMGAPTLAIYDPKRVRRIAPLPAPPDPTGLLRAAYSVPTRTLTARGTYALELAGGETIDLPAPTTRRRPRSEETGGGYVWLLRARMAERGMHHSTDLVPELARRGQPLSGTQVYRLVTGRPQRLKLELLAALCDILGCTPNDLIEIGGAPVRSASQGAGRQR